MEGHLDFEFWEVFIAANLGWIYQNSREGSVWRLVWHHMWCAEERSGWWCHHWVGRLPRGNVRGSPVHRKADIQGPGRRNNQRPSCIFRESSCPSSSSSISQEVGILNFTNWGKNQEALPLCLFYFFFFLAFFVSHFPPSLPHPPFFPCSQKRNYCVKSMVVHLKSRQMKTMAFANVCGCEGLRI